MAYYADLGPIDYFRHFPGSDSWRAVGWLERGHSFVQGEVTGEFVRRLAQLIESAPRRVGFFGYHGCDLCPASSATGKDIATAKGGAMGIHNLWVPGNGVVYVAPELILHYIEKHGYRPPDEFISAALNSPEPDTQQYVDALAAVDPSFKGLRLKQ